MGRVLVRLSQAVMVSSVMVLAGFFFSGLSEAQQPGDRVLGQWSDGLWYPARIQSVQGNRIRLNFDDGDVATVGPSQVRWVNWSVGSRLQCNWKNQGRYYSGVITQVSGEQIFVAYDDGDREQTVMGRCRSN
ncbi:hypothetical protein L3556_11760 [Candidatus Synechococcus calcipolaris G9]|uniref:Tudor domain-containing protein n=1 Tax=Candidatus Synechococcus calcipolaris G9 TaxID=1497997 RepID=A0ABT6F165_9SYNE|nr:hypothetical protein [Candidatus Synechococcus calcipolaris]MDG2991601.1 hypothetical protein [Candidatus Synechococcus calcipolaris G9]